MNLKKVNASVRGGPKVKLDHLLLPPWTKGLPDHTNITVKDIMEYNQVHHDTVLKYLPKIEKTEVGSFRRLRASKWLWSLRLLREHMEVGPDGDSN